MDDRRTHGGARRGAGRKDPPRTRRISKEAARHLAAALPDRTIEEQDAALSALILLASAEQLHVCAAVAHDETIIV